MELFFATSNDNKVEEFRHALKDFDLKIKRLNVDVPEIDDDDVESVAEKKARDSFEASGVDSPVMVEDSGLYVESLNGFPGSMSGFFIKKCGEDGLLKLMKELDNRQAFFKTSIAIYFPEKKEVRLFSGKCFGNISREIKGNNGFGYDPIFIPENHEKTFAEDIETKKRISHRKKAVDKLKEFIKDENF